MNHPYDIIQLARNTSSKNEKIAIIKAAEKNELFRRVVNLTLNPFIRFGMTKIPKYTRMAKPSDKLGLATIEQLHADLAGRKVTGHDARDYVIDLLSKMDERDAAVIECIIKKDFDAGFSESTVNKAWGDDFIPTWPVMLCEKFSMKKIEKHIKFPAWAQLKMDGARINVLVEDQEVSYFTRNGNPLQFGNEYDHIFQAMADHESVMFDGEVLIMDDKEIPLPRKTSNGIVKKALKGNMSVEEIKSMHFTLWDMVPLPAWKSRMCHRSLRDRASDLLDAYNKTSSQTISLVETTLVKSFDEATKLFQDYLAKGQEGLIIKDLHSGWEDNRVSHQIKMKAEREADLLVTGWEPHSKNSKLIGALVVETSCGKLRVGVGSGLDDEMRAKKPDYFMGKVVAIVYNELIQDKKGGLMSMFLPRIVEVRFDKTKANSLKELS